MAHHRRLAFRRSRILQVRVFPIRAVIALGCFAIAGCSVSFGQDQTGPGPEVNPVALPAPVAAMPEVAVPNPSEHKRVLWILPNYKTSPSLTEYEPISTHEKFKIATQDSFDRAIIFISLVMAGKGELFNATPQFGHGVEGYAKYFGAGYADLVMGDYMTEAIYPTLLHQDPRYFRLGSGGGWRRLGHAMSSIVWTHSDSGRGQFNFSEILGNSTGVAISNAYYPADHTAEDGVEKLFVQMGLDMSGNIMKEFWPDVSRWLAHKRSHTQN
jgi:hypothetical protein